MLPFSNCLICGTLRTNKDIERAYLDMAHTEDALVTIQQDASGREMGVKICVRNMGHTPCTVTRVVVNEYLGTRPLPPDPPYPRGTPPEQAAFLVPTKRFYTPLRFFLSSHDFADIVTGTKTLWIIGYVDYTDHFGQEHRRGYTRRFSPLEPHNLSFEMSPGYNYDRRIETRWRLWPKRQRQ